MADFSHYLYRIKHPLSSIVKYITMILMSVNWYRSLHEIPSGPITAPIWTQTYVKRHLIGSQGGDHYWVKPGVHRGI